jgi:hypothetical protein
MIRLLQSLQTDPLAVFWAVPVLLAPRVLGLIDREPESRSRGCADRWFWKYRMHDFANARFQEASHLLALLYGLARPENPFFQQPHVRATAVSCVRSWLGMRHRDGSVDEAYPRERSFCAGSFSCLAAVETMRLLPECRDEEIRETGRWLARHGAEAPANQVAASALALWSLGDLFGDGELKAVGNERAVGLARQGLGPRGCFLEYGGEDMGYHTLTLSLLARLAERTGLEAVRASVASGIPAFARNLDENGRIRADEWSRQTQFVYPYAAAGRDRATLTRLAGGICAGLSLSPLWQDDRYMIPLCSDYLLCANALADIAAAGAPATPAPRPGP